MKQVKRPARDNLDSFQGRKRREHLRFIDSLSSSYDEEDKGNYHVKVNVCVTWLGVGDI